MEFNSVNFIISGASIKPYEKLIVA